MKHFFSAILFLLLWTPTAARAAAEQPELIVYDIPEQVCLDLYSAATVAQLDQGIFDPERPGYGAQLTDPVAIAAYNALVEQCTPENTRISMDLSFMANANWSSEVYPSMLAALSAYVFDHPESQFCTIQQYGRLGNTAVFLIALPDALRYPEEYALTRQEMAQRYNALKTAAADYAANFDTSLPMAEQYRIIHDDVCRMAVYNHKAAASGIISPAYTAYGLLVDGDAVVCEGYSKAFKILCDAVGLPCMLIAGEASQSSQFTGISNHMWNAVEVDGSWYYIDTTWDDVDLDAGTLPGCPDMALSLTCYPYFLDNTPFLSDNPGQNHRASGNIYFQSSFPMTFALPDFAQAAHPAADPSDGHLTIHYYGTTLDIPKVLWNYQFNGVSIANISDITIRLSESQTLSRSFHIPTGKSYVLESGAQPLILSRAEGFEAPMFILDGSLTFRSVTPVPAPGLTLATVSGGSLSGLDCSQMSLRFSCDAADILCLQAIYSPSGALEGLSRTDPTSVSAAFPFSPDTPAARTFLLHARTLAPVGFDLIS